MCSHMRPVGVGLQGPGRLLGVVQIPHHHGGSGQADLPFLAGRQGFGGAAADDFGVHVRKGDADAPFAVFAHGHGHDGGHRLGEPVSFPKLNVAAAVPDDGLKSLLDHPGQGVGAGEGGPNAAQIRFSEPLAAVEGFEKGRHADDEIGAFGPDEPGHILGRELGHQNAFSAPHEGGVDADPQAESVKHRQNGQNGVFSGQIPPAETCIPSEMKFSLESMIPLGVPVVPPL